MAKNTNTAPAEAPTETPAEEIDPFAEVETVPTEDINLKGAGRPPKDAVVKMRALIDAAIADGAYRALRIPEDKREEYGRYVRQACKLTGHNTVEATSRYDHTSGRLFVGTKDMFK